MKRNNNNKSDHNFITLQRDIIEWIIIKDDTTPENTKPAAAVKRDQTTTENKK